MGSIQNIYRCALLVRHMTCGIIPSHIPRCGRKGDRRATSVASRVFWDMGSSLGPPPSSPPWWSFMVELGVGFPWSEMKVPCLWLEQAPSSAPRAHSSPTLASLRAGPSKHRFGFTFTSTWLGNFCRHQVQKVFPEPWVIWERLVSLPLQNPVGFQKF